MYHYVCLFFLLKNRCVFLWAQSNEVILSTAPLTAWSPTALAVRHVRAWGGNAGLRTPCFSEAEEKAGIGRSRDRDFVRPARSRPA